MSTKTLTHSSILIHSKLDLGGTVLWSADIFLLKHVHNQYLFITGKKSTLSELEEKFLNSECSLSELLGETEECGGQKYSGEVLDMEGNTDIVEQAA